MQFSFSHCTLEASQALLGVCKMQRTGDGAKLPMSHLDQITCCIAGTLFVVCGDAVAAPVLWETVNAYNARAGFTIRLGLRRKVAEVGWNNDKTSREVGAQFIEVHQLLRMIVVCIAEDQAISV